MAKRQTLLALADDLEPSVRQAFLQAVYDMRDDVDLSAVVGALERDDLSGAVEALRLEGAQIEPLRRALAQAYTEAGDTTAAVTAAQARSQGVGVVIRFGGDLDRASQWLTDESARLVTAITDETRQDMREVLSQGMEAGRNPRAVALDITGRINRATKRREGGLIGLTGQQVGWSQSAYAELVSGEPELLRNYLTRQARDRRFDRLVQRALRDGQAVSRADAAKMVRNYRNRLLKMRGDTIARTEMLSALHEGQAEMLRQLVESGKVPASAIGKVWDATYDKRTRISHAALDGKRQGADGVFTTIHGHRMKYPGDTSLGAPASEIINCRCHLRPHVDFRQVARMKGTVNG